VQHAALVRGRQARTKLLRYFDRFIVGQSANAAQQRGQEPLIVPIPGTGKVKHLQENIESTKLVLTAEDMKEIDSALAEFKVHGGRMNEEQMKVVEQ
jgi:hypothetical protein